MIKEEMANAIVHRFLPDQHKAKFKFDKEVSDARIEKLKSFMKDPEIDKKLQKNILTAKWEPVVDDEYLDLRIRLICSMQFRFTN